MPVLDVSALSVDFRTDTQLVHAVDNVSFAIDSGERVGLVGESGSGKTTTALALMRMIRLPGRVVSGVCRVDGVDVFQMSEAELRAARLKTISYVPQGAMNSLNPTMRIRELILEGMGDHGISFEKGEKDRFVERALERVGLSPSVARLFPHQLSGGMKQRVCIAMAISLGPKLIIADEPTSALDVITQRSVMSTLIDMQDGIGSGLLLIGHDMGLMAQVVHRVMVMRDGRIVEDAAVGRIFKRPKAQYSRMLIESVPSLSSAHSSKSLSPSIVRNHANEASILEFDNVSKVYGSGPFSRSNKAALLNCSFKLSQGCSRIVSIVGQSGSGKSTLGRLVLGLESPTSGVVRFMGKALSDLTTKERLRHRREVQGIFQDPYSSFNPFYRVDRTLALPLRQFGIARRVHDIYGRMASACSEVGLVPQEVLGRFPHELSGGQRQRLMVARALLLRPRVIVADEPVSMVDASLRMTILENLRHLRNEYGIAVLYITHDLATAYQLSDFILVLHNGRVVEAGSPEEVIMNPMHPYTKSLIQAVPTPDPDIKWPPLSPEATEGWGAKPVIRQGGLSGFSFIPV